jgi:GH25 family lysozyme M1 (1,4-beta-N-acetylmuramidase)
MRPDMIDLSHNNDPLSFHDLKAAGVVALAQKATQGSGFKDPSFSANMARADEVEWFRLPYHFGDDSDPEGQFDNYSGSVTGIGDFYPIIDYEVDPAGNTMTLSKLERLNEFMVSAFSRHPVIYGPKSFLAPILKYFPLNPFWPADLDGVADYIPEAQFLLQQFSWDGDPGRVPRGVDCSQWMFSTASFADWYGAKKIGYPVTRPAASA